MAKTHIKMKRGYGAVPPRGGVRQAAKGPARPLCMLLWAYITRIWIWGGALPWGMMRQGPTAAMSAKERGMVAKWGEAEGAAYSALFGFRPGLRSAHHAILARILACLACLQIVDCDYDSVTSAVSFEAKYFSMKSVAAAASLSLSDSSSARTTCVL